MTGGSDHIRIPTHTILCVPCHATQNACDACIGSAQGPRAHRDSAAMAG